MPCSTSLSQVAMGSTLSTICTPCFDTPESNIATSSSATKVLKIEADGTDSVPHQGIASGESDVTTNLRSAAASGRAARSTPSQPSRTSDQLFRASTSIVQDHQQTATPNLVSMLEKTPEKALLWVTLGARVPIEGPPILVSGIAYTRQQCFSKALEVDRNLAMVT